MRKIVLVAVVLTTTSLPDHAALAGHAEPAKGNKATFSLVNGYADCSDPNTATSGALTPACAPAVSAGACAFSPGGSGKLTLRKTGSAANGDQDLKIIAAANGLNPTCEGGQLHVRLSYRLTTDDCPEGSCTTTEVLNFNIFNAFCTVAGGRCRINTTLNAAAPGLIATMGKNAGITILGCGLKEFLFPIFPAELQCGVLLK